MPDSAAPKITLDYIESLIVDEYHFTAFEGVMGERFHHEMGEKDPIPDKIEQSLKLMSFCILVLKNGFTVVGKSACASPALYNKELGQTFSRENAVDQLWEIIGYELKTKLASLAGIDDRDLNESLTRMTAMAFGNDKAFQISDADRILSHFNGGDKA